MGDFQHTFYAMTARFRGGAFTTAEWARLFKMMRKRLAYGGASHEEQQQLKAAIEAAIDRTPAHELNDDQRTALRDVVCATFDSVSRRPPPGQVPPAHFLEYVKFTS